MDKHLKVLYIKVPSIHSPLRYEVNYNTTQVMSELQLMSRSFGKSNVCFEQKIRSVSEECGAQGGRVQMSISGEKISRELIAEYR